ncbi:hypothetical protein Gotur_016541, partial [Gossypium turneri]
MSIGLESSQTSLELKVFAFCALSGCSINETNVLEKDGSKANIAFGWKVELIGYRCGVVFGLAMGCVVFQTGKAKSNLEHLDLSWMSSSTEFIDSVDNLQALEYLDLSGNSSFQGLSVSITNLSSLEQLIISGANFFGGLPDSMGNLVSLKFLHLSNPNLLGPVPSSKSLATHSFRLVGELIEWTNSKIIGEPLATHLFKLPLEPIEWTDSKITRKPIATHSI